MFITKASGKRERPIIVILVYIIEGENKKTRIVIEVILKGGGELRRVRALIDSSTKANYLKRRLAV